MKPADLWNRLEPQIKRVRFLDESFTFMGEMGKRSLSTNAAGIAFYFFISMIPFSILLCSQLPYTGISKDALIEAATGLTPDSVDVLVSSLIAEAYTSRIALFSVSLLALMWSSSKVITAMIRALDAIYRQNDRRNFFAVMGSSLFYTLALLVGCGVALILFAKGKTAEEFLLSLIPTNEIYQLLSKHGHRLLIMLIFILFFALLYTVFPAGKRNFFCQLPGAVLAQVCMTAFSSFFAFYNAHRNVYRSFYGSLANLAVFLIWLYTCFILFLLGAVFNAQYQDRIRAFFKRGSSRPSHEMIIEKQDLEEEYENPDNT